MKLIFVFYQTPLMTVYNRFKHNNAIAIGVLKILLSHPKIDINLINTIFIQNFEYNPFFIFNEISIRN